MKKILKNKKIAIPLIGIITFFLVTFNIYFYINRSTLNTNYYSIKENNSLIVYPRYTRTYKEIVTLCNGYLKNNNNVITYDYKISGDILSVVLQINCYDQALPQVIFKTYNINLKEKKILDENAILDLYGIDKSFVANKIKERFEYFFKDEREKKIFDEECDYKCFLYMRRIENYTDNIYYYIDSAKLYVYKEFNTYSIYNEEKYYKNTDFKIEIA